MARFAVGDEVRVSLPKGKSKRGIPGVSVLYSTSMESRFEGAVGTITEINPRGPYGLPICLVDFAGHQNRVAIPWQSHWFRDEWLIPAPPPRESRPTERTPAATA